MHCEWGRGARDFLIRFGAVRAPVVDRVASVVLAVGICLAQAAWSAPPPANVGLKGQTYKVAGELVAFIVNEEDFSFGTDLNGNAVDTDSVLYVYDHGTTSNLRLSPVPPNPAANVHVDYLVGPRCVVIPASELIHNRDLNGDGDIGDRVLHFYDADTRVTTNLRLDVDQLHLWGCVAVFTVSELRQGLDLNGDSDTNDFILHRYDLATGLTNMLVDATELQVAGNWAAFLRSEANDDEFLNGDGDMDDLVLHVADLANPQDPIQNAGIAVVQKLPATFLPGLLVSEAGLVGFSVPTGLLDSDFYVYDAATQTGPTNMGMRAAQFKVGGETAAFLVREATEGQDLNGDGDQADHVLHVSSMSQAPMSTGLNSNPDPAGRALFSVSSTGLVAFEVVEAGEGAGTDLTGDLDTDDIALYLYTSNPGVVPLDGPNTFAVSSPGLEDLAPAFTLDGDSLAFSVCEACQGENMNGDPTVDGNLYGDVFDTDQTDFVLHLYDGGLVTNLGIAIVRSMLEPGVLIRFKNGRVTFVVNELDQGSSDPLDPGDLNADNDRDLNDNVLHVFDPSIELVTGISNPLFNLRVAVTHFDPEPEFSGNAIAFEIREGPQNEDLNNDLDFADLFLQVAFLNNVLAPSEPDPNNDDDDGDGVLDVDDNCPLTPNPLQENNDANPGGDACDDDDDNDGVLDALDNCPLVSNPNQEDADGDAIGDACLSARDEDGDAVENALDNCPFDFNADQADADGDGLGDICDLPDTDGDRVPNVDDNCPSVVNADQRDGDGDGIGDACEGPDADGDGTTDALDNCPVNPNPLQSNVDGDANGDVCDACPAAADDLCVTGGGREVPADAVQIFTVVNGFFFTVFLEVEPGDLFFDATLSVTEFPPAVGNVAIAGPDPGLGVVIASHEFRPNAFVFRSPVTLRIDPLDTSGLNDEQIQALGLYRFDAGIGAYVLLEGSSCASQDEFSPISCRDGVVEHFTEFVVLAPTDTDGDGIFDLFGGIEDLCPDDPEVLCGAAEPDGDGDGVPDAEDNCEQVGNPGQADLDGDLVGDLCDVCPADDQQLCDPGGQGATEIPAAKQRIW